MKYCIILLLLAASSSIDNCYGLSADLSMKESVEKKREEAFETNVEALKKELMQGKLDAKRLSLQYFFDYLVSLRGNKLPMFTAEQFESVSHLLKNYTDTFFEKAEEQLKKNPPSYDDDDHEHSTNEEIEGTSAFLNLVANGPLLKSETGLQLADIIRAEQLLAKFVVKFGYKRVDWILRDGHNIIPVNMFVDNVPGSKELSEAGIQSLVSIFTETCRIHEIRTCKTSVRQDAGKNLYPAIQKVNEQFYVSKIPDTNLTLVMERVTKRTQPLWLRYAEVQCSERVLSVGLGDGKRADGALHFRKVLRELSYTANEIWVVYVTKADTPQQIPDEMDRYCWGEFDSFAKNIEMYVTVTSSENALITSHMGITHSAEAAAQGRAKGISLDLHSFGAKVMLMRNPKRKYMLNAPNSAMEKIIANAIPHAVFVGTREMRAKMLEVMKDRENCMSFDEFKAQNEARLREELIIEATEDSKEYDNEFKRRLASCSELREAGESEASLIQRVLGIIPSYAMVELKDGNIIVSVEKIAAALRKKLNEKYKATLNNPYWFSGVVDQAQSTECFLEFMKKHPPRISVDGGKSIYKSLTIFNAEEPLRPWLCVDDTNSSYQWLFTQSFACSGITHYILVDLKALADNRQIA